MHLQLESGCRALTEQQEAFVLHYTSTPGAIGNGAEAARRAGYSERSAGELARQLLDKSHIRDAILAANRAAISGRLATKSVALLEQVIDDQDAPLKVRVEAAKTVLDRAGFVEAAIREDVPQRKSLGEMTRDELEAIVAAGADLIRDARLSASH